MADTKNTSEVKNAQGGLTKKEAVEKSLAALGNAATAIQLQKHIRERFGIDMGLKHISTAKGKIIKEAAQSKPAVPKPAAEHPASPKPLVKKEAAAKAAMPQGGGSQDINLRDIESVKDLVERVGAASLKKLIDVMAR